MVKAELANGKSPQDMTVELLAYFNLPPSAFAREDTLPAKHGQCLKHL